MNERPLADLILEADPGLRDFFLGRLVALALRQAVAESPHERRILGMGLFSTFLDCVDLGLTEEASQVIEFVRDEFHSIDPEDDMAA